MILQCFIDRESSSIFPLIPNIELFRDEIEKTSFILLEFVILMQTIKGRKVQLLHDTHPEDLTATLLSLRNVDKQFLSREVLHNPLLLPDIQKALQRIASARVNKERVMIFGDYDVDGISSTAALFLFLRDELGMDASYRLPHRVHDGYGIKSYHMDEIASVGTKLVITVDCGTKDKEPIEHAATL